jgi:hypothetical protein
MGTKAPAQSVELTLRDHTMRNSGRLLSLEKAAHAQQVSSRNRAMLRQHYEASSPPMSDRLAEVIKKLELQTVAHND